MFMVLTIVFTKARSNSHLHEPVYLSRLTSFILETSKKLLVALPGSSYHHYTGLPGAFL